MEVSGHFASLLLYPGVRAASTHSKGSWVGPRVRCGRGDEEKKDSSVASAGDSTLVGQPLA